MSDDHDTMIVRLPLDGKAWQQGYVAGRRGTLGSDCSALLAASGAVGLTSQSGSGCAVSRARSGIRALDPLAVFLDAVGDMS